MGKCPHNIKYDKDFTPPQYKPLTSPQEQVSATEFVPFLVILVGFITAAITIISTISAIIVKWLTKEKMQHWQSNKATDGEILALKIEQIRESEAKEQLNQRTKSMFLSPVIPISIRYGMPFIIMGNIGLFLSGHLSLGATVNIQAEIAGEAIIIEKFFQFSMAKSTV